MTKEQKLVRFLSKAFFDEQNHQPEPELPGSKAQMASKSFRGISVYEHRQYIRANLINLDLRERMKSDDV